MRTAPVDHPLRRLAAQPALVCFVLAVVARLAGQVLLGAFQHPETWEYEDIANNILAGHGYTYAQNGIVYVAAVSSPLYVYLTAGVYWLTGHSQGTMLVLQALLGGVTAALVAWMAGRAFSRPAAWIAGALVAVDPALVVYAAKLHSLTLDVLGFVGVLCLAVALPTRPGWRALAGLGALLGLAALSRTTALFFLPILAWWLARYRGVRLFSRATAALACAAVLVFAPWSIRSSILLGQFVPGSSESTEWMWRGTNPNATGSSWTADGRLMLEAAPAEFRARVGAANEAERIGIYRDATLAFVSEHPAQAAGLYLAKLRAFWWGSSSTGILYPSDWVPLYDLWYVLVLVCAAGGTWWALRAPRARPIAVLVLLGLVVISASQALFYVEGRHRIAMEPFLLLLAGGGLASLSTLPARQRARPLATRSAASKS